MKVLITGGSNGQLKRELLRTVPEQFTLVEMAGHQRLDICDAEAVSSSFKQLQPDLVINAAAYTAVDHAESESSEAYAVNDTAVSNICRVCADINARVIHLSTDFVFAGQSSTPYQTGDATQPLSVYGASKLAGERHVLKLLPNDGCVIRTSWVYSSHGQNFVKTMLRLMSEREELGIVSDQIGTPTWAAGLASAVWRAADLELNGVLHWTDAGVASWYDFAHAIHKHGLALGLLSNPVVIKPIQTVDYPTPAARPAFSVLDKTESWKSLSMESTHWEDQLLKMLEELL